MDPFEAAGLTISKKYVISLDHRQDRKDSAKLELEKAGIKDWKFFPGFNTKATGVVARNLVNPGTTGCYLSHQFLIHEALANNYENILIMEDDLGFVKDFNTLFPEYWKDVPANWDLVWIGCNEVKRNSSTKVTDKVAIPGQVWGAHCYLVSRSGITKIYNYLNKANMRNHVDITINKIVGLVQYTFTPGLSNQKGMGTDNVIGALPGFINRKLQLKNQPQKLF